MADAVAADPAADESEEEKQRLEKIRFKRENVIKEIIDTESTYVTRLQLAKESIIIPLQETRILNATDLQNQFKKLEDILELHSRYSTASLGSDAMKLVELFDHLCQNFEVYSEYLIDFEKAMQRRAYLLTNNRKFAEFIDKAQKDPNMQNLDLESLLIMPVQRIPRYRLLLEQLLKYTPEEHPDYPSVRQALDKICNMAQYNNEAIRERENKGKLMSIMMQIEARTRVDLLDDPKRKFIKDGALLRQCRRGLKEFHFWLLSDQLLYGQSVPPIGFMLNRQIPLSKCYVSQCESIYNQQHSFIVESPQKSFIVMTSCEKEKIEWVTAIKDSIEQQRISKGADSDGKLAPLWIPDATSTRCTRCQSGFTLIFRRHHCRNCGAIVCERCSSKRFLLEHVDHKKQVRVCDDCHDFLTSQEGESVRRRNSSVQVEPAELRSTINGYYDSDGDDGDFSQRSTAIANGDAGFTESAMSSVEINKLSGFSAAVRDATANMFNSRRSTVELPDEARSNIFESELDDFNDMLNDPQKMERLKADLQHDVVHHADDGATVLEPLQRQLTMGLRLESLEPEEVGDALSADSVTNNISSTRAQHHHSSIYITSEDHASFLRDSIETASSVRTREESIDASQRTFSSKIAALNNAGMVIVPASSAGCGSDSLLTRALPPLPSNIEPASTQSHRAITATPEGAERRASNFLSNRPLPPPKPPKTDAVRRMTKRRTNVVINFDQSDIEAIEAAAGSENDSDRVLQLSAGKQDALASLAIAAAARGAKRDET